jgi:hypothetical protein
VTKQFKQMTAAEARTAFYLDFEGPKDQPPALMGYLRKERVQQYVVDRTFEPAGPRYLELPQAIKTVLTRAEKQDRRIVSWSEHDLDLVRELISDPDLVRAFEARYANGRALAARWATRTTGIAKPADGDLENYLPLVRFEVPDHAGPGNVGKTLRSLRPSLEAGRDLTEHQLQRWADLLDHNSYDCLGARAVCIRAATDLERVDKRSRKARKGRKKRRKGTD